MDELFQNGFCNRCETTKWVWITKHFEWNPPENPNQRKAIAKVASQIPDDCTWKRDFMRVCGGIFGAATPSEASPSETVSQPLPNQEQEQEELQLPLSSCDDDVKKCPVDSLIELYHELMPMNPQCKVANESRKSAIKARWKQAAALDCEPFGYTTKSSGLNALRRFFEVCAESKFLTGQAPPLPGKPAFVADIDFIFSPSGFARTLENKYHREAA